MSDCSDYPTVNDAKGFKTNADTINEVVTSSDDRTSPAIDGETKLTLKGIESATDALIESGQQEITDAIESTIGKSYLGVWTQGVTTFTTMNEYSDFNGITYKPKSGITLPYTAQTTDPTTAPDNANVEPFSDINSATKIVATGQTMGRTLSDRFADTVNVKDFGATGDGVTDDTVAIQAAIDSITQLVIPPPAGGSGTAVISVNLLFPPGVYKTSSALNLINADGHSFVNIIGDKAGIYGDGNHDCFYFDGTYRTRVEGIEFQNFDECISFDTNNIAGAIFEVTRCAAFNSALFINTREYVNSRSTVLNINNCFSHNTVGRFLITNCDMTNITSCNIQHGTDGTGNILSNSKLTVRETLLVPYAFGPDTRWIDYLSDNDDDNRFITVDSCRVSGEGGGISLIYNFAQATTNNRVVNGINLINNHISSVSGGPSGNGGIVILADDGGASYIPNYISFQGNNVNSSSDLVKTTTGSINSPGPGFGSIISIDSIARRNSSVGSSGYVEDVLRPYIDLQTRDLVSQRFDDETLTDIDSSLGSVVEMIITSATTISTISNPASGQTLKIVNPANNSFVTVKDNSTAANGIYLSGGSDVNMGPFTAISLVYVAANNRWVQI